MKRTYGVWAGEFEDNDTPDYYTDRDEAFDAWHALADELTEGESAYMQRFTENGEVAEDFPRELRCEDGGLHEYYGGERLWVQHAIDYSPARRAIGGRPKEDVCR